MSSVWGVQRFLFRTLPWYFLYSLKNNNENPCFTFYRLSSLADTNTLVCTTSESYDLWIAES